MRTSQRSSHCLTALILTLVCALVLGMGSASAATTRSFGAEGHGAGEFESPRGIAISQDAGEAFIADHYNNRIDAFATSGAFLRAFGWGVASAREEPQTCTSKCFVGYEGAGAGELSTPEGVTVDNDPLSSSFKDLYVFDQKNYRVEKFSSKDEFLLAFGAGVRDGKNEAQTCGPEAVPATSTCLTGLKGTGSGEFGFTYGSIAVASEGTVYVGDVERVQRFNSNGIYQGQLTLTGDGDVTAVAVNGPNELYVKSSELAGVREYENKGKELGAPRDKEGAPGQLALNAAGDLIVADGGGHIFEYNPAGEQVESFGAGVEAANGIAYDEAEHAIYALGSSTATVLPIPPEGPLVLSETTEEVKSTSTTLAAVVNPEGPAATSYHFEYGTSATYTSSTPATALSGQPFEDQNASAPITGLAPARTYHFRVVVTNAKGKTTFGEDQTFTTLPAVSILSESASLVSADGARLEAELNPQGSPAEFHFEYDTTPYVEGQAGHGVSVPVRDASAGAGTEPAKFSVAAQNLTAETTYHYRVVAHNALGTVYGPDQTFTTQGAQSAALIDGRAWEMVSPSEKQGAPIEAIAREGDLIQAAADGHAITYAAGTAVTSNPEGNRPVAYSQVFSTRPAPGAWSTQDIATKHEGVAGLEGGHLSEYQIFSLNLESAIVEPLGATPLSPAASERTPYRREANGSFTPLVTAANVQSGVKFGGKELRPEFFSTESRVAAIAATPDDSHVLLSSPQPLTPGVELVEGNIYLYEWSEGTLQLASVLPDGAPASGGAPSELNRSGDMLRHGLSAAGDRVVFASGVEHLYLRDMTLKQSIRLDTPEAGLREQEHAALFEAADSNGSRIFFLDEAKLTANATARSQQPDLYECEVRTVGGVLDCGLKDLTVDANLGESAHVLGSVLGADESGSYVYFVANGRLAPGATRGNCKDNEGELEPGQSCNLYVLDTVTGQTRLVAKLSGADFRDWFLREGEPDLTTFTSRVSPNGQYLAFMSERPLTGFDNRDAKSGKRDEEVYEYSYAQNALTCVSCSSSGVRPEGALDPSVYPGLLVDRPLLWPERWLAASIPGWTSVNVLLARYQSRYLSDSGRMFFNSATPLVPSDTNGLEDVYEYEPSGTGGCTLASGCVGLISSGTSSEESAFMDASENGNDVFFLTSAKLSKSDVDNAYDLYDAHVCSSEAPCAPEPATAPPPCGTADACRTASASQPDIFGPSASQTFSGAGNVTPTVVKPKAKPLTRAQKLSKALSVCKKDKNKKKKAACVRRAKKLYGPQRKSGPKRKR